MAEDNAFLQAIIDNPDDDDLRLVYADWLDDHGQGKRAEFIRVQCELARLGDDDSPRLLRRREELVVRERELLRGYEEEWAGLLPRVVTRRWFERGFLAGIEMPVAGFSRLADLFDEGPTVRDLRLVGTFRHGKPTMREIAASPYLARLTALDISRGCYHIRPEAVAVLAASSRLAGLTTLGLHENAMGPGGLAAIATSPHLGRLTTLSLSCYGFNPQDYVGADGVRALTSSPLLVRLTTLRLTDCGVNDEACEVLATPDLPNLKSLDLRRNSISRAMKVRLRLRFGVRVLL